MFLPKICSVTLFLIVIDVEGLVRRPNPCPDLTIKFGRVKLRQKGRFVRFQCNPGFLLAGDKYSTCSHGEWDSPAPKCVRPTCPKVSPPVNGQIYPSHRGGVLNFFCKPDYTLRGSNITYCDGRQWSDNLPSCIPANTKPLLSCEFESEDLCGWTQDLRHDFDWLRINSRTPSGYLGTGPVHDHTKGENENGYYMYIESSGRNENDTARLISPVYDKISTNACFKFYYHMYGASMGSLRVYLKEFSDNWNLKPSQIIFSESGNHGDKWIEAFIRLGPIEDDFQIIIEGVSGPSYISDLAIDDVQLIEDCKEEEETTITTEEYETVPIFQMESCVNRCNNNTITASSENFQISCDCDELCTEKNSCCPDFIAVCVIEVTEESNTDPSTLFISTIKSSTINLNEMVTDTDNPITPLNKTTINSSQTTSVSTVEITTIKTTPIFVTKISIEPPNKTIILPTRNNATKQKLPIIPIATKINSIPVKMPTLQFLTPSVTPPIIRKKLPIITKPTPVLKTMATTVKTKSTTVSSSTTKMTTLSTKPNKISTKITSIRPISKTVTKNRIMIDEIITLPSKKEETLTTTISEITNARKEAEETFSSASPKNAKIVIATSKSNGSNKLTAVLISTIVAGLCVIVCVVTLIRRYNLTGCKRINRFKSSGNSQSDVRFLTCDEHLDFTLGKSDDY